MIKKLVLALLLLSTGALAIYAVSHRWYVGPELGPRLKSARNYQDTIAGSREPAPLLGVVLPRPGIERH